MSLSFMGSLSHLFDLRLIISGRCSNLHKMSRGLTWSVKRLTPALGSGPGKSCVG